MLLDKTLAIPPAASSVILLLLRESLVNIEKCFSALQIFTQPAVCRLFPLTSSSLTSTLQQRICPMFLAFPISMLQYAKLNTLSFVSFVVIISLVNLDIPDTVNSLLLRLSSCNWVFVEKTATKSFATLSISSPLIYNLCSNEFIWRAFEITITPLLLKSFPCKFSSCSPVLWDMTLAMSCATSSVQWLSCILSLTKVDIFPKALKIFFMPIGLRRFPSKFNSCSWVLWDNTPAILSADSPVMLQFTRISLSNPEVYNSAFESFTQLICIRLFICNSSSCSWTLWDRRSAISCTASLLMLFPMYNFNRDEVLFKAAVTLKMPLDLKQFALMYNSFKCALHDKTRAILSAASSVILLLLRLSLVNIETCCSLLQIFTQLSVSRLFPLKSSSFICTLQWRMSAMCSAASKLTLQNAIFNTFKFFTLEAFIAFVILNVPDIAVNSLLLRLSSCNWVLEYKTAPNSYTASSDI